MVAARPRLDRRSTTLIIAAILALGTGLLTFNYLTTIGRSRTAVVAPRAGARRNARHPGARADLRRHGDDHDAPGRCDRSRCAQRPGARHRPHRGRLDAGRQHDHHLEDHVFASPDARNARPARDARDRDPDRSRQRRRLADPARRSRRRHRGDASAPEPAARRGDDPARRAGARDGNDARNAATARRRRPTPARPCRSRSRRRRPSCSRWSISTRRCGSRCARRATTQRQQADARRADRSQRFRLHA